MQRGNHLFSATWMLAACLLTSAANALTESQHTTLQELLPPQILKQYYRDLDQDRVPDPLDECPNTLPGVQVNNLGCELDSDLDGVADSQDVCMQTTANKVNFLGCNPDTDRDGVQDSMDRCPKTPLGRKVDAFGCTQYTHIQLHLNFDTGLYALMDQAKTEIQEAFAQLKKLAPYEVILIEGHTDAIGCQDDNMKLSWNRAESVRRYLVETLKLPEAQIYIIGYGELSPVTDNHSAEGRAQNRRIDLKVLLRDEVPEGAKHIIPESMKGYVRRPNRCPLPDDK